MNKKGLALPWETIIPAIVVIAIGIMLFLSSSNFLGKGEKEYENIREQVTDKSFLNLPIGEKSDLLKEKEKCDKLSNSNACLGSKDQKSGCFWGKIDNQEGCYSCLVKKIYFGNNYGKCLGYKDLVDNKAIISDLISLKNTCETNPCDFASANPEKKAQKTCLLSTLETRQDIEMKNTFCY